MGGYLDLTTIADNAFLRNKYHAKIGDYLSGNIALERNDFINWTPGIRAADVWLVPNTTNSGGTNTGPGTLFDNNKFGNENQADADCRILIALEDEASGTDRSNRSHSTTWTESGATVSGLTFRANRVVSRATATGPFIRSYVHDIRRVEWSRDNYLDGGQYSYLIEFMGSVADEDAYTTRSWAIDLGSPKAGIAPFSKGISNRAFLATDMFGVAAADRGVINAGLGDEAGLKILMASPGSTAINLVGTTTRALIPDALGMADRAARITFGSGTTGDGFFRNLNSLTAVEAERLTWLHLHLQRSAVHPVSQVLVQVRNQATAKIALNSIVTLPPSWEPIRLPFILPGSTSPADWVMRIVPVDYDAGVADTFDVGQIYAYHARAPLSTGHLRVIDACGWNTPHLILGSRHEWFDANGRRRTRSIQPISDTDGTLYAMTRSGSTGQRPVSGLSAGDSYYDTTLGKPIWWSGSAWKDAAGTTV